MNEFIAVGRVKLESRQGKPAADGTPGRFYRRAMVSVDGGQIVAEILDAQAFAKFRAAVNDGDLARLKGHFDFLYFGNTVTLQLVADSVEKVTGK